MIGPAADWYIAKNEQGWVMPTAPRWKRWPFIRHLRCALLSRQVAQHNSFFGSRGLLISGYDNWVLHGIWTGQERVESQSPPPLRTTAPVPPRK